MTVLSFRYLMEQALPFLMSRARLAEGEERGSIPSSCPNCSAQMYRVTVSGKDRMACSRCLHSSPLDPIQWGREHAEHTLRRASPRQAVSHLATLAHESQRAAASRLSSDSREARGGEES